jgi:hypothetical protein
MALSCSTAQQKLLQFNEVDKATKATAAWQVIYFLRQINPINP